MEGDMAGVEARGWVRGKPYERKAEKVRNAEEVEVWEKWRSLQELQARAWGKERVTKVGKTPSSALDTLRFIGGAGGAGRGSDHQRKMSRVLHSIQRMGVKMPPWLLPGEL